MQEAHKAHDNSPGTLAESLTLVASLRELVQQQAALIASKDALIDTQSQALDESLKARDALLTQIDEHTKTIERLMGIYQKRRERFEAPRPLLDMLDEAQQDQQEQQAQQDEATLEALAEVQANLDKLAEQVAPPKSKPRKKRNYQAPAHWPRVEVPYQEDEPTRSHCPEHGPREIMGYEIREKAVMVPARFYVEQTKVPKYKCAGHPECGIQQQPAPEGLVKGDKIDTSIGAQIVVQKYMYHVPIYRTEDIFASSGWRVARGTLLNIVCSMAYLFEGLYRHYRSEMISRASLIATDETQVKLILPDYIPPVKPGDKWSQRVHEVLTEAFEKDKSTVNARMWAYRSVGPCPWNVFDFTISRHRDGPERFLENFRGGTLLGDCYAGYESLHVARGGDFKLAACNAHARRKLKAAQKDHPKEASLLLAIYRELYDVEAVVKGKSCAEIVALRQQLAVPLWARLESAINAMRRQGLALPKSKLGEGLGYMENNWETLTAYLLIGDCPIDNNECEQLMKHTATGRKNWLFLGSIEAGYRAAILTTICSTAHRHHLDVYSYLKDVADQLLAGNQDYEALRAENWAKSHPEQVREYRVEQARYAADRKHTRRAERRREQAARSRRT